MADSKITALTSISTSTDPANDPLVIVDVSDTSMAATGTTKKVTLNQLLGASGTATLASATITGDLTVRTNKLKVTSIGVGAGTTTPAAILHSTQTTSYDALILDSDSASTYCTANWKVGGVQKAQAYLDFADDSLLIRTNTATGPLKFGCNNIIQHRIDPLGVFNWYDGAGGTRMTLNSTGLLVGTTSMPSGVTFARLVAKSTSGDWSGVIWNSNATPYGLRIQHDTDSNGTGNEFLYCLGGANLRASIRSNGGIANYQANNVSLSDSRLKTDIKPLASYWNKIKSIELVTFKYKDQTHSDDNIGLIAQQVESVAPELVDVDGFGETPDDGVPIKTIYTTDLYHAAIKALQEAMTRIEALEAKLA